MDSKIEKTFNEVANRNLKRSKLKDLEKKYAKIFQCSELMDEAIELKAEIDSLKRELGY